MSHVTQGLVTGMLLLCAASLPALAASSTASSASDSVSTSVGSASDSVKKSSNSSSKGKDVAAGDYKVIEMAALPDRPGMVRVALQAVADGASDNDFVLILPQQAAEQGRLALGQIVSARQRPYGVEFAQADTQQAFFLVMDDAWHRELPSNPVTL